MNRAFFSDKTKLSDLIHTNYKLLFVLPRFEISLGFGESTVSQICTCNKISVPLFLLVCNVYTFENYTPITNDILKIPANELINYLKCSHEDYLNVRIPDILHNISKIASNNTQSETLMHFWDDYAKEVHAHCEYEEKKVFPYILSLMQGSKSNDFKIVDYEKNHTDIEVKLNDLKNIIIKYIPQNNDYRINRNILLELFWFEEDLNKHALLEDKILVSMAECMERNPK